MAALFYLYTSSTSPQVAGLVASSAILIVAATYHVWLLNCSSEFQASYFRCVYRLWMPFSVAIDRCFTYRGITRQVLVEYPRLVALSKDLGMYFRCMYRLWMPSSIATMFIDVGQNSLKNEARQTQKTTSH